MDNSVFACACEIEKVCDELKALLPDNGAFYVRGRRLLEHLKELAEEAGFSGKKKVDGIAFLEYKKRQAKRIQERREREAREDGMKEAFEKAIDEWRTTDDGHKIHFGENGEPDMGNPYVVNLIQGEIDREKEKEEAKKKYPRKRGMTCEDKVEFEKPGSVTRDSLGRVVTHFNHGEDTMKVTRQVKVKDEHGREFRICREPIEHLTVFAAKGVGRGLDAAEGLSEQVGGSPESWKHVKGIGTVIDRDGNKRKADLHWFESPETGQVEWKIKKFLDDMDEEEQYW